MPLLCMKRIGTSHKMCFKYTKNIGPINRAARLIVGAFLIALGLFKLGNNPYLPYILGGLGIILILEAIGSFCIIHGLRGTKDMR